MSSVHCTTLYYKHGIIADITPGHPKYGMRVPLPEQRRQQRAKNKLRKQEAKKIGSDAIPTQIAGPLCSPPPQISSAAVSVSPAPFTPIRRERNRSRARHPGSQSTPRPSPTLSPPRPPQMRQQTRKESSSTAKPNDDDSDEDLPNIIL